MPRDREPGSIRAKLPWTPSDRVGASALAAMLTLQPAAVTAVDFRHQASGIEGLLNIDLSDLKRYRFRAQVYMTFRFAIFRSGYTGEDGVELVLPINLVKLALPALFETSGRERCGG